MLIDPFLFFILEFFACSASFQNILYLIVWSTRYKNPYAPFHHLLPSSFDPEPQIHQATDQITSHKGPYKRRKKFYVKNPPSKSGYITDYCSGYFQVVYVRSASPRDHSLIATHTLYTREGVNKEPFPTNNTNKRRNISPHFPQTTYQHIYGKPHSRW